MHRGINRGCIGLCQNSEGGFWRTPRSQIDTHGSARAGCAGAARTPICWNRPFSTSKRHVEYDCNISNCYYCVRFQFILYICIYIYMYIYIYVFNYPFVITKSQFSHTTRYGSAHLGDYPPPPTSRDLPAIAGSGCLTHQGNKFVLLLRSGGGFSPHLPHPPPPAPVIRGYPAP